MSRIKELRERLRENLRRRVRAVRSPEAHAPAMPAPEGIKLGFAPNGQPIVAPSRTVHSLYIATSGGGKSNELKLNVRQRLLSKKREAVVLIDGNGGALDSPFHDAVTFFHDLQIDRELLLYDVSHPALVCCANALAARPDEDLSVVAGAALSSIASRGNERAFDDKPTLRYNLSALLTAGAELGATLPEVADFCDVEDRFRLRQYAIERLTNEFAADELRRMRVMCEQRSHGDFNARVLGSLNRMSNLVRSKAVRASLGGQVRGPDFGEHLARGGLIFVNAEGSKYASEIDVKAWANLILSTIVRHLLVRDDATPCHIYIDECQHFLGSDTEPMLRELRKRKVSVHLYTQTLSTFERVEGLLPVILGCTEVFGCGRLRDMDDAETVTRQRIECDLEAPLAASIRPTVIGQRRTTFTGMTLGTNHSEGTSRSTEFSEGRSEGETHSRGTGRSEGTMRFSGISESEAEGTSFGESDSLTDSSFAGESAMTSMGAAQTTSVGAGFSVENDAWGTPQPADVTGFTAGNSQATSTGSARGTSRAAGSARGRTTSRASSRTHARAFSEGEGTSVSTSESEAHARSRTRSSSRSSGLSHSATEGRSEGTSTSEGLESVYADLPGSYHPLAHQQHRIAHLLCRLLPGQMFLSFDNRAQVVRIPLVKSVARTREELNAIKTALLSKSPAAMPIEEALAALEERRKKMRDAAVNPKQPHPEPDFKPAPMPFLDDPVGFADDFLMSRNLPPLADPPPSTTKRRGPRSDKAGSRDLRVIDGGRDGVDKPRGK